MSRSLIVAATLLTLGFLVSCSAPEPTMVPTPTPTSTPTPTPAPKEVTGAFLLAGYMEDPVRMDDTYNGLHVILSSNSLPADPQVRPDGTWTQLVAVGDDPDTDDIWQIRAEITDEEAARLEEGVAFKAECMMSPYTESREVIHGSRYTDARYVTFNRVRCWQREHPIYSLLAGESNQ